jgi:hypothetical protein
MSTNFYFNNFPQHQVTSEQLLVEDLVIEAMQIHGMDVYYLPRSTRENSNFDMLYGEDTLKQYRTAVGIEMYLENVTGMDGEGDFISKFGLEIRDEVTMLVSRRRFAMSVNQLRPLEGDLIYIPMLQNFFEITFVEHENNQAMFYTLGRGRGGNVYLYAMKMKQFVFSNEIIQTGIDEIDGQIFDAYPRATLALANTTVFPASTGQFVSGEIIYQGSSLATANAQAIVHSYTPDISVSIIQVQGQFASGNVTGNTSGALRSVIVYNDNTEVGNDIFEDIADNTRLQTEGNDIIDFTEHNPFGEP